MNRAQRRALRKTGVGKWLVAKGRDVQAVVDATDHLPTAADKCVAIAAALGSATCHICEDNLEKARQDAHNFVDAFFDKQEEEGAADAAD